MSHIVDYYKGYELYIDREKVLIRGRHLDLVYTKESKNRHLKRFVNVDEAIRWIEKHSKRRFK